MVRDNKRAFNNATAKSAQTNEVVANAENKVSEAEKSVAPLLQAEGKAEGNLNTANTNVRQATDAVSQAGANVQKAQVEANASADALGYPVN